MQKLNSLDNYEIGQMITLDIRRGDRIRTVEVKIMDISQKLPKNYETQLFYFLSAIDLNKLKH